MRLSLLPSCNYVAKKLRQLTCNQECSTSKQMSQCILLATAFSCCSMSCGGQRPQARHVHLVLIDAGPSLTDACDCQVPRYSSTATSTARFSQILAEHGLLEHSRPIHPASNTANSAIVGSASAHALSVPVYKECKWINRNAA